MTQPIHSAGAAADARRSKFAPRRLTDVDSEIVDLLLALLESFKVHMIGALESVDLPMSQGHLLITLDEPTAMSDLARSLGFDASHITSMVDRLEERHLVERTVDVHDRRVKRIALTDLGEQRREQIRERLFATLPPFSRLTVAQREQLRELLATALGPPDDR